MQVTVTEILVDSSNNFEGIIKEDSSVDMVAGQSVGFNNHCNVHHIDIVDGGIVVYYVYTNPLRTSTDNEKGSHTF